MAFRSQTFWKFWRSAWSKSNYKNWMARDDVAQFRRRCAFWMQTDRARCMTRYKIIERGPDRQAQTNFGSGNDFLLLLSSYRMVTSCFATCEIDLPTIHHHIPTLIKKIKSKILIFFLGQRFRFRFEVLARTIAPAQKHVGAEFSESSLGQLCWYQCIIFWLFARLLRKHVAAVEAPSPWQSGGAFTSTNLYPKYEKSFREEKFRAIILLTCQAWPRSMLLENSSLDSTRPFSIQFSIERCRDEDGNLNQSLHENTFLGYQGLETYSW